MIKFNLNGQFIDTFGNNGIFQNFENLFVKTYLFYQRH